MADIVNAIHHNTDVEELLNKVPNDINTMREVMLELMKMRKQLLLSRYESWARQYERKKDNIDFKKKRSEYSKKSQQKARATDKKNMLTLNSHGPNNDLTGVPIDQQDPRNTTENPNTGDLILP